MRAGGTIDLDQPGREAVELFGLTIDALTLDGTVDRIDKLIRAGGVHQHACVNVDKVVKAENDPALAAIVNACDVVSADGQPIVWASRLLGRPLPERVTGIDLMQCLIERSATSGHRMYFLGARPAVLSSVVNRVRREHPRAMIAGAHDGYWSADEEEQIVGAVAASDPDILFLAIPSPDKERFLDRWKHRIGAGLVMGVGGSFDVYAGQIPRAPRFFQRAGLEWLFRLVQEPRRMWRRYLLEDMRFLPLVIRAWLRERGRSAADPSGHAPSQKILVVTNLYPNELSPWFGTFVRTRVEALRSAGASVRVAAITDATVHRRVVAKYLRLAWSAMWAAMGDALGGRRYLAVEAHLAFPTGWLAWPAARLHRAPLVLYVHGSDVASIARRSRIHRTAARTLFGRADLVVVNSEYMREQLVSLVELDQSRVIVESPGIDHALFSSKMGGRARSGVLFVGRLNRQKGILELLDATDRLREGGRRFTITVIGDGPERATVEAYAARPGADIDVRGPLPPAAVAEAMRSAAVCVMPSTYGEALGLVALEAMAAGAIVVASRTGGLASSVTDGVTGIQVAASNVEELAAGIARALDIAVDERAAMEMRAAAAAATEAHAVDQIAARSLKDYRRRRETSSL